MDWKKTKEFEFNNKKDKTEVMGMNFDKHNEIQEALIEVRKGKTKQSCTSM